MKKRVKRLTIELDEDVFSALKIYCINNDISMKDLITELVKNKININ